MKRWTAILLIGLAIISCKKAEEKTETYPGVFTDLESTHTPDVSCGMANVYIALSDTSVLLFNLNDEELDITLGGSTYETVDLTGYNGAYYYEWTNHPDSLAPNFCDDIAYVNQVSIRKWRMTSGTITAAISKLPEDREFLELYDISMRLQDGVFDRSESGLENITFENIIVKDAKVGWLPG